MGRFAWRNLRTRPLRTALALIGLSIPILGVLGLFSISQGLRNMVGETLSQVEGVMLVRENTPSPVFSELPADLAPAIAKVPGVRVVAPELWKIAPSVEGKGIFSALGKGKGFVANALDQPVIQGEDIPSHARLKSAVFPRAMKEGRFLGPGDQGKPNIVISRKIARDHPGPDGKPRKVGDTLHIGGKPFEIVGLYETGSMLLDVVIVTDIGTARNLLGTPGETVSSYYVETSDPTRNEKVTAAIEKAMPNVDARSMTEFAANFGALMGSVDTFLMMTVSLALVVGVVGIINTMLMSTSERFIEFGVLRTNGWSKGNILALVTLESGYLGLFSGIIGCLLASVMAVVANQFASGGMRLLLPPWLFAVGIALSLVTGTLGGLYPAWRAARLVPMDAIRVGSH
ncbi:MAG: putative transport system permease protein [Chloroflexota bacterium]|nr:putative transport system permease protein [Chloroflexota bacterium]